MKIVLTESAYTSQSVRKEDGSGDSRPPSQVSHHHPPSPCAAAATEKKVNTSLQDATSPVGMTSCW